MKKRVKFVSLIPRLMGTDDGAALVEAVKARFNDWETREVERKLDAGLLEEALPGDRQVIGYASTRTVDRDREVMVPDGCDFEEFRKNAIRLWSHNYGIILGRETRIKVDDFGIKTKTTLARTREPSLTNQINELILDGYIRTSSVGFFPLKWVNRGSPEFYRRSTELGKSWAQDFSQVDRIIEKWLLLEISFCAVPANPDALVLEIVKGDVSLDESLVRELGLLEKIQSCKSQSSRVIRRYHPPLVRRLPHPVVRRVIGPEDITRMTQEALDKLRGRVGPPIHDVYR